MKISERWLNAWLDPPVTGDRLVDQLTMQGLEVDGVTAVFFGLDFLTVTKRGEVDWAHIKPALLGAIMDHYVSGAPILRDGAVDAGHADADAEADETTRGIIAEIKELLDTRIRPAVAGDGGDITFNRFDRDTGRVFLTLRGSCSGCPSSTATLKMGVENLLKHYVPEVTSVEAVA